MKILLYMKLKLKLKFIVEVIMKTTKMQYLKYRLKCLIPSFWIMNHRYNKVVDLFINHLIDNYEIISNDCYTCTFNDEYETVLWLGNYPYAYGTLYSTKLLVASQGRPSRMTVQRLSDKVDEYIKKKFNLIMKNIENE